MVTGNYFSNADVPIISIHNVDHVRIEGNHIDWKSSDISEESSDWLYLQDCANTSVEENKMLGYK